MPPFRLSALLIFGLLTTLQVFGETRDVKKIYAEICSNCHGANFQGGAGPSLVIGKWKHGGDDASLARSIRDGYPQAGMPAWSAVLSDAEVRAMVVYIHEESASYERGHTSFPKPVENLAAQSELYAYRLETFVSGLNEPWAMSFLPDGRALVTEKRGNLRLIEKGKLVEQPVTGIPAVENSGQAGLFDVVPHPDYIHNGWIYLAYADPEKSAEGKNLSMTAIVRGHLRDGAFVGQETIFKAPLKTYRPGGGVQFGGRIAFDDKGYIFFSIGDRGPKEDAQKLGVPNGKIHRLHDDGRVPTDNPFVNTPGAAPSIWSYGHRNPQGLCFDRTNGELWETEHGPRGGDEINLIRKGLNYGWPVVTYGIDYSGLPLMYTDASGQRVAAVTSKEGMEPPVEQWTPSIAVSGASFYTGGLFPMWKGNLFVASLKAQELRRVEIKNDKVIHQEIIFKNIGRIRDVLTGPDGAIYVLLPDRVSRLIPDKK
ncbi:MAG TPA: PQQ-dependent sugar dehydrogenase [Rariglobus sp.]|jgi:glucose/arabinose dehydrogenase|nr:PQQ-dependent sugar dehydrogenase [Rariglobus sp.]